MHAWSNLLDERPIHNRVTTFVYTLLFIFTCVDVSSMLENGSPVKKQKRSRCRISDSRQENVDEPS